jgi:hypothetical protein
MGQGRTYTARALAPTLNALRALPQLLRAGVIVIGGAALAAAAVVLALGIGWFVAYLVATSETVGIAGVGVVVYAGLLGLFYARVRDEVAAGKPIPAWWWVNTLAWSLVLAAAGLGSLAGITALLISDGHPAVRPMFEAGDGKGVWVGAAYEHYLWHLADSIPVLKVPDTVTWKPKYAITDTTNGVLTLAAKILVILPFLAIARGAFQHWDRGRSNALKSQTCETRSDFRTR